MTQKKLITIYKKISTTGSNGIPGILGIPERLRQEDCCKFTAILVCIASSRITRASERGPVLKELGGRETERKGRSERG